jgi:hypothetical protein
VIELALFAAGAALAFWPLNLPANIAGAALVTAAITLAKRKNKPNPKTKRQTQDARSQ